MTEASDFIVMLAKPDAGERKGNRRLSPNERTARAQAITSHGEEGRRQLSDLLRQVGFPDAQVQGRGLSVVISGLTVEQRGKVEQELTDQSYVKGVMDNHAMSASISKPDDNY